MSNMDLHKAIDNAMSRPKDNRVTPLPVESNGSKESYSPKFTQTDKISIDNEVYTKKNEKSETKKQEKVITERDKKYKKMGIIMIGIFVGAVIFSSVVKSSNSVNVSDEAKVAIEEQVSSTLPLGTRLMSKDEALNGQDLTITHSSTSDKTKIYIWDYAAEDGDYVQVFVDGVAVGDPFEILNKPVELEVPTVAEVKVVGTHDGGGGITYAIHYDLNGKTYFNGTDTGNGNTYTLVRE